MLYPYVDEYFLRVCKYVVDWVCWCWTFNIYTRVCGSIDIRIGDREILGRFTNIHCDTE